ncbi:YfjI family protein [Paracoccus luteus]|uniref:YfjI family protein n=1 Tax=Paracoccus luteus TaxID=2508543 RepID=UPI0010703753|nr:YfjI family protein [Paracoccus luteus]
MNAMPEPIPFKAQWPDADLRLLRLDVPLPPPLPLAEVLSPRAAEWVAATAEGAGAPPDYVLAALLSVTGATMGNARWVSPWKGWAEPPNIWTMCIGNPSAGKSPAIDAVLAPLRRAERPLRQEAEAEMVAWEKRVKLAKLAQEIWDKKARAALDKGNPPPPVPKEADDGTAPHIPRLIVNDGTVERLGVIAQAQPKGFLQMRDELAGWLLAMEARNGGSDRAFWLEAYGGRAFTVERMGRAPLTVNRLTIGALGGIQPDRLSELLTKTSDDGLLARFLPIWPGRVPVKQPERFASDEVADAAMARLTAMQMPLSDDGEPRPWFVGFDDAARDMMNEWRQTCGEWETGTEGLLLSFIGKLPGMAARLALVLATIGHAFDGEMDPAQRQITPAEFGRACHFLESYILPMARRAYGVASVPKEERSARRLASLLREMGWQRFTAREIRRMERRGLASMGEINPALSALEEADLIRAIAEPAGPSGGRPQRLFIVNPAVHEVQS